MFLVGIAGIGAVVATIWIGRKDQAENGKETRDAIAQMSSIANSMADEKESIDDQASATSEAAKASQKASEAASRSADAADKQAGAAAEASLATNSLAIAGGRQADIANQAFLATDRPWLGVTDVTSEPLEMGKPFKTTAPSRNFGRAPALDVRSYANIAYYAATAVVGDLPRCAPGVCAPQAAFPGTGATTILEMEASNFTAEEISRLTSQKDLLVLRSRSDYSDVHKLEHTSLGCMYYDLSVQPPRWNSCYRGNTAD